MVISKKYLRCRNTTWHVDWYVTLSTRKFVEGVSPRTLILGPVNSQPTLSFSIQPEEKRGADC